MGQGSFMSYLALSHQVSLQHTAGHCRDFVVSSYAELKKANPQLPILIREAQGAEAKLTARYGEWLKSLLFAECDTDPLAWQCLSSS